ncbi:Dihydrolipoamide acetyltransferase component of pyruvate dehydrogenase complex [Candidatus Phaeomarinobacter ectocarpi]|uniref:Acetyltransferase component of pyruvate dehydrogenase complex n=1 Tax=Candidatus Phaeomarinibacter ectocarpi TaxID=1458461 RepID=X5MP76_9HYPH|nr:pyruvate dehydrogenase complex dihydrolipoamide acetyltransferase [Candidatus Phaeomarinobacter ectocarpi]CDO61056.1 Dihydrolipoamide acetyltransferase component of pyruvate dehydrogenase complex [Candidatus Phaeomarinobacter ectocarpi]
MPIPILMPALSPTMEEGTLAKWLVKEGDSVASGDVIAEIETDKATMEVEAVDEGTLAKILIDEGTEGVEINKPIAVILEEGEDDSALEGFDASGAAPSAPSAQSPVPPTSKSSEDEDESGAEDETPTSESGKNEKAKASDPATPPAPEKDGERIFASPLARRIAADKGIDLSAIEGSGPHGRIIKADVESATPGMKAAKEDAPKKAVASSRGGMVGSLPDPRLYYEDGSYEEVPLDGMRKSIAKRLTQSKQEIPHYYLTIDCELDELLRVRKELNARGEKDGIKVSVNDFIIRASALALMKVPDCNVSYAGDALLKHKHADIGVAVALDGGLITPIVKAADTKGLAQISAEVKDLAARAKDKKLKPSDYEGGSFSVSNLGMFGIKNFTAVINPPQSAIMAVGAGEERPVVKNGTLGSATMMTVTLSCDHRAIDGALGAQLLQAFKILIEDPLTMLL